MSCHLYDNDIDKCLNIEIKKNKLQKYKCQFIIHNEKISKCIKKGNLKKHKGFQPYKNQKFDIKDREMLKIPKINLKQAQNDTKRYIGRKSLNLKINGKETDPKILLEENNKIYNLIKILLSPNFHNDMSINTFKYCSFIQKIFKMNTCPNYIMCNTEVDYVEITIHKYNRFEMIFVLKGDLQCINFNQNVDKRSVDKTNIKITWNQNTPEYVSIKYNTPKKSNLYTHYKKSIISNNKLDDF